MKILSVWKVDKKEHTKQEFAEIKDRAMRLQHQDDLDNNIRFHIKNKVQLRAFGFPTSCDHSTTLIDYNSDVDKLIGAPRSTYGIVKESSILGDNHYELSEINWNSGVLDGFSGAPIIGFLPNFHIKNGQIIDDLIAVPFGVTLTGTDSSKKMTFISINVVTDLIAQTIRELE